MKSNLVLYIVAIAMFVAILTFVGILSLLAIVGVSALEDRNYSFDDPMMSIDFLYLLPTLTLLLIIVLFIVLMFKENFLNLKKKGDGKNK